MKKLFLLLTLLSSTTFAAKIYPGPNAPVAWDGSCASGILNLTDGTCLTSGGGGGAVDSVNTLTGDVVITGIAPLDVDPTTAVISMPAADGFGDGYLNSTDWNSFNQRVRKTGDTMSGDLFLFSASPPTALSAAPKAYVDSLAAGVKPKASVDVATTGNIVLVGEQTIDGFLTSSSRVLVQFQTIGSQNGIYVSAAGAWTRSSDLILGSDCSGIYTTVINGATYGLFGRIQQVTPCTTNTTAMVFGTFGGAGYFASGQGIVLLGGNIFALQIDGSTLSQSVTGVKVATGGITNTEVSASAGIDFSKLAALTSGNILVGSAGNVATSVAMSSEASIIASGAVTLSNAAVIGKVLTGFVSGAGTVAATDTILQAFQKINGNVAAKISTTLADGKIIVGNVSNVATAVDMSGDATIINTGAVTLKAVGTAGTYTKVTTDAQGRVSAGTAAVLASSDYANQGTTTTVLHGNAAGNPSFGAIANADMSAMANNTVKGNKSGGSTTPSDVALGDFTEATSGIFTITGTKTVVGNTTIKANLTDANFYVGNASNVPVGVAMSGDATLANTGAITIANSAVTNAKLANMAQSTFKGRAASSGTGAPIDLSATQATAILNPMVGDSGAGGVQGLVPAPATGDATKCLSGAGTFVACAGGGSGSVTSVSVVSANGLAGTVATATTTPAITLSTTITGILKGNGTAISAASAGTDYEVPLTFSTGLTRTVNTITANLSTGVSGGQSAIGGTASGNNLTLSSTSNATKGKLIFGTSAYDEVNNRLGIGLASPTAAIDITGASLSGSQNTGSLNITQTWSTSGTVTGIKEVITNTGSNAASRLIDLQTTAGGSQFSINLSGDAFFTTSITAPQVFIASVTTPFFIEAGAQSGSQIVTATGDQGVVMFAANAGGTSLREFKQTSGSNTALALYPHWNQATGSATNTDILLNRIETAVGSGLQKYMSMQTTSVEKIWFDDTGRSWFNGSMKIGGATATLPTSTLDMVNTITTARGPQWSQYNTGAQPSMETFRKARGSEASPTTVATSDFVALQTFSPYVTSSGFLTPSSIGAVVNGTVTTTAANTGVFIAAGSGTESSSPFSNTVVRAYFMPDASFGIGGAMGTIGAATGAALIGDTSKNLIAPISLSIGSTSAAVTNGVLQWKDGHEVSTQTTPPVATVNANAGTGATCSVSNATDSAGNISLTTTAVAPASGAQCSIAFNKTYNTAPICQVTNTNNNSILFSVINGVFFTTSTSALVVNYANADAAGHANTMSYRCIETQ